jgi:hypothetical protein
VPSIPATDPGFRGATKQKRSLFYRALEFIGRHPLAILILPSIWFLLLYLPFWKSTDVMVQLGGGFSSDNILLVPPIYCILGRIPFWFTDTLLSGSSPNIFAHQHPSLPAIYCLVVLQHAGLWFGLRYFVFGVPASEAGHGVITLLVASIASFYSFAHTAGAEATTAITWFTLFGVGLRILSGTITWKSWLLYSLALLLCIGSRHVSSLLLGWFPVTAIVLMAVHLFRRARLRSLLPLAKIAGIATLLSMFVLGIEQAIVWAMCANFKVVQRQMVGRTLCERIGSFLDSLSPAEKERLKERVNRPGDDPDLKLAIDSLFRVGTYYQGTNEVIAQFSSNRQLHGDRLAASVDTTVLKAASRFYQTLDPRLVAIIGKDVVRGFYPTNDQGIALTGPKATFYSVEDIAKDPEAWTGISSLVIFNPAVAGTTLNRALHDDYIRHWRFMPIAVWCLSFLTIGAWRMLRGTLPVDLAVVAMSIFGIGLAVYVATCVCNITQPRYVLPFWVGTVASGCVVMAGRRMAVGSGLDNHQPRMLIVKT